MKKLFALFLVLFSLGFVSSALLTVEATSGNVDLTITAIFDEGNKVTFPVINKEYGTTVTHAEAVGGITSSGYEFVFWIVNGIVRADLDESATFTVTSRLNLQAVYKTTGEYVVVFVDANGVYLGSKYTEGGTVTDVGISLPGKPNYTPSGWISIYDAGSTSLTSINADSVFMLQYVPTGTLPTVNISVTNGTAIGEVDFNTVITVTADAPGENETFSHWEDNGHRVSYDSEYTFTALTNRLLEAKYVEGITPMPLVSMSEISELRTGYKTYVGQFYIPEGYELIEYGFITSNNSNIIKKGDVGVTTRQSSNHHELTNEFVTSFNEATHGHEVARAYLTVRKDGEFLTVHSNYQSGETVVIATDLFISEYIEGSGTGNKIIELFNGTGSDIDLSNYSLNLYSNGSASVSNSVDLSGILSNNSVFVLYHGDTTFDLSAISNKLQSNAVANFNGDDAISLMKNNVIIDLVGVIGTDPGSQWGIGTGTNNDANSDGTANNTLVRKANVFSPATIWNSTEWIVFPIDTSEYLGSHENSQGLNLYPVFSGNANKTILIYDEEFQYMDGIVLHDDTDSVLIANINVTNNILEDVSNVAISELPVGQYDVEIEITNTLGNSSIANYTLTIWKGNVPVISGTSNKSIQVNDELDLLTGVTATDSEDGSLTSSITVEITNESETVIASINTSIEGVYSVKYSVTDSHGNLTTTTIQVTVSSDPAPVEVVLYSTGFEAAESFTAGTSYNNTTIKYDGLAGQQWGTYYGTASTTGPIIGSMSMQMRWYTANQDRLGYTFTNFSISNVTKVTFKALNTSGNNVKVSYSTDGGTTYVGDQTFTLGTSSADFTYNINQTGPIRVKFTLVPGTTNGSRVTIDDVVIYGYQNP